MNGQTIINGKKKCTRCGELKILTQFNKNKESSTGLNCCCKDCSNAINKRNFENPKYKEYQRKYRKTEKFKKYCKKYWQEHKHKYNPHTRERRLKYRFNLSLDDYNKLLDKQGNVCDICKKPFPGVPNVDHDHKTGKVRGLLCVDCNRGLGCFKDNIEILKNAIEYLSRVNTLE